MSSKHVRLRPLTCHNPVTPGFTSRTLRRCQRSYTSNSYGTGGRGPTRDISPRSTFHELRKFVEARLAQEPPDRTSRADHS